MKTHKIIGPPVAKTSDHPHLILVGAVHLDPSGYDRLMTLLSAEKPDIITLEFSPYGRGFRTKYRTQLSRGLLALVAQLRTPDSFTKVPPSTAGEKMQYLPPSIQELIATISFPYEYRAAKDYAVLCKVPLYCIDLSSKSRTRLQMLKREALSLANVKMLMKLPDKNLHESVKLCYKRARALWQDIPTGIRPVLETAQSPEYERELHMSRRIRNLLQKHPRTTILHIGGWEHIAGGTGICNLYHLLKELYPRRILLENYVKSNLG